MKRRAHNIGWWTSHATIVVLDAWTVKGPKPKIHDAAVARLREDWPQLANALDALVAAAENGPPQCPSRWPDGGFECHLRFGHIELHRSYLPDGSSIEWKGEAFRGLRSP